MVRIHLPLPWIEDYLKTNRSQLLKKETKTNTKRLIIGSRGESEVSSGITAMLEPLKVLYPERLLNAKTIRASVIANWLNIHKHRVEIVQEWAGHKWPSSTLRYKRIDIAEQREKINKWHPLR